MKVFFCPPPPDVLVSHSKGLFEYVLFTGTRTQHSQWLPTSASHWSVFVVGNGNWLETRLTALWWWLAVVFSTHTKTICVEPPKGLKTCRWQQNVCCLSVWESNIWGPPYYLLHLTHSIHSSLCCLHFRPNFLGHILGPTFQWCIQDPLNSHVRICTYVSLHPLAHLLIKINNNIVAVYAGWILKCCMTKEPISKVKYMK